MLEICDCRRIKSIRICDNYKAGEIEGVKIEAPDISIFEWADVCIISSFYYRTELYGFVKSLFSGRIVDFYQIEDSVPFWESEINLDIGGISGLVKDHTSVSDLYKYVSFSGENFGEAYKEAVEKNFFNAVTKAYYLDYIKAGDRVIDIGAGTGRLTKEIHKVGGIVTAVDTSHSMLEVLRRELPEIETKLVADERLPFENESFDVAVSCDLMVHLFGIETFLKEHSRVIKSGGYIIYNIINSDHLAMIDKNLLMSSSYISGDIGTYYSYFSKAEIENICKNNGSVILEKIIPFNFFYQSAFSYGVLTRSQMLELGRMISDVCRNEIFADVIGRFEREVVSNLPEYYAANNICVFRKT